VLEDGKRFTSPSAAGSAVMGGTACNGWRFWAVEGEAPATKEHKAEAAPNREPKGKAGGIGEKQMKLIARTPNQRGLAEGQTRYFCNACMKSFLVEGEAEPEACPEGHRANDAELTAPAGAEVQTE
jgi:hypothetical protein